MKDPSVSVERFDSTGASGFVPRNDGDTTVILRLVDDKRILSVARAELFRPDVVASGKSSHPYCGFVLPVPVSEVVPAFGKINVVTEDGTIIASGAERQKLAINSQSIPAGEILDLCSDIFCGVDGFEFQQGILAISGIVLPPNGRYQDLECIGQNGVAFKWHWPVYTPSAEEFYWYYPGSPYIGFRIDINLAQSADPSSFFEFYFRVKGEEEARTKLRNISLPKDLRSFQNFPSDFSVKRVQQLSSTIGAMITGFTDYRRVINLASRYLHLGSATRVLDWGCGFGRVVRHFHKDFPDSRVFGAEIDDLNLNWMREHLPSITPIRTDLDAKIDLPDQSVDLIYGISVMTHIRESQQEAWLRELARILSPDGVLILTTCGSGALAFGSRWISRKHLNTWRDRGFVEHEQASEYDRDIGGDGYYIQANQSSENTRRRWGRIIDIVDIIPCVFGYQDAVIMRHRKATK